MKISDIRITTICENTTARNFLLGEWGISFLVEAGHRKVLFDTGGGNTLLYNADKMGIDLSTIDSVVLSHGHQDHTGGLRPLLDRNHCRDPKRKVNIYTHPDALDGKYVQDKKKNVYYMGILTVMEEIKRLGAEFITSTDVTRLEEDIIISGEVPLANPYEKVSKAMVVKDENGALQPDTLADDLALYLKTEEGLVVVAGCAHRGIINTIKHGQEVTGLNQVFMVIGGTHLFGVPEEQFSYTVEELKSMDVNLLGVSHCTGLKQAARLHHIFGEEKFFFNNAGTVIEFKGDQAV